MPFTDTKLVCYHGANGRRFALSQDISILNGLRIAPGIYVQNSKQFACLVSLEKDVSISSDCIVCLLDLLVPLSTGDRHVSRGQVRFHSQ